MNVDNVLNFINAIGVNDHVFIRAITGSEWSKAINGESINDFIEYLEINSHKELIFYPNKSSGSFIYLDVDHKLVDNEVLTKASCVTETPKGYHLYWRLNDEPTSENMINEVTDLIAKKIKGDILCSSFN